VGSASDTDLFITYVLLPAEAGLWAKEMGVLAKELNLLVNIVLQVI